MEAEELGTLVGDLLLIARGDDQALAPQPSGSTSMTWSTRHWHGPGPCPRRRDGSCATASSRPHRCWETRRLLERALLVLLHNALIHAPGSVIELSTGVTGNGDRAWSWATMRDHGPGIPALERERVFERFARLNTGVAGAGLGLAIARSIAEAHWGTLTLDEVPEGASFTLRVPAG